MIGRHADPLLPARQSINRADTSARGIGPDSLVGPIPGALGYPSSLGPGCGQGSPAHNQEIRIVGGWRYCARVGAIIPGSLGHRLALSGKLLVNGFCGRVDAEAPRAT